MVSFNEKNENKKRLWTKERKKEIESVPHVEREEEGGREHKIK